MILHHNLVPKDTLSYFCHCLRLSAIALPSPPPALPQSPQPLLLSCPRHIPGTMASSNGDAEIDAVIDKLVAMRGKRPGTLCSALTGKQENFRTRLCSFLRFFSNILTSTFRLIKLLVLVSTPIHHRETCQENDCKMVCTRARDLLLQQPMLLELSAPIKIVGGKWWARIKSTENAYLELSMTHPSVFPHWKKTDTHGQFYDRLRCFEYGGFPPEANYLFLGDYVDRGKQRIEVATCILAYKIKECKWPKTEVTRDSSSTYLSFLLSVLIF